MANSELLVPANRPVAPEPKREVNTRSAKLRSRYAEAAHEQREANARAVRGAGADHLVLRTDSDWLFDVIRFVVLRRKRMEVKASK